MSRILVVVAALACLLFAEAPASIQAHTGTGTAHLEIDMDTTNGVCTTVDASLTVSAGALFTVAVCLSDGEEVPLSGDLASFSVEVGYPAFVTAPDVACSEPTTCLDSNPDFQNPAPPEAEWDCNAINLPASEPSGTPSPAMITCGTQDVGPHALASGVNDVLALISFTADAPGGPSPIVFTGSSNVVALTDVWSCDMNIACTGGAIQTVVDAVGGVAEQPDSATLAAAQGDSSGNDALLYGGVAAALAVFLVTAGGLVFRRRWTR
ncbi:MAG: hypothetical protein WEC75_03875 [Dehalococcoidia bacterium]